MGARRQRGAKPVESMTDISIDTYLAACVKACIEDAPLAPWPATWPRDNADAAAARIKFHGIALLLVRHDPALQGWPEAVVRAVKDEARMQALWEASHHTAVRPLVEALANAGIIAAALKGTALGYGFHADPAVRRRGDTDLLLVGASRPQARGVLERCGFVPAGDRGPTQEPWEITGRDGFTHEVDVHWRINGSLAVSKALERLQYEQRIGPLPRLAPSALALGAIDNLILTCVNRFSHQAFGYHVEDDRPTDGNRLIWAADMVLICKRLSDEDWALLAKLAISSGSARVLREGLAFAGASIGLALPEGFLDRLAEGGGAEPVAAYLGEPSHIRRLQKDLAAVTSAGELADLLRLRFLPGRRFMDDRFPDAQHWPLWALHVRRMAGGVLRRFGLPT